MHGSLTVTEPGLALQHLYLRESRPGFAEEWVNTSLRNGRTAARESSGTAITHAILPGTRDRLLLCRSGERTPRRFPDQAPDVTRCDHL